MDQLLSEIDKALKRKQMSASAASHAAVGHPAFIKNLRNRRGGDRLHPVEALMRLAEVLDMEFYVGPVRAVGDPSIGVVSGDEFVRVPRYLVELSAGPGQENHNADQEAPLAFRADWMRERGLNASDCVVLSVTGESMVPTLYDGDLVLIDCSPRAKEVKSMQLYAFADRSGARVKRLEKLSDRLILRSDNLGFATEELSETDANDLTMIGKVVWSGHTV